MNLRPLGDNKLIFHAVYAHAGGTRAPCQYIPCLGNSIA